MVDAPAAMSGQLGNSASSSEALPAAEPAQEPAIEPSATQAADDTGPDTSAPLPALSKSARKKLMRYQHKLESRANRRAAAREATQQRKREVWERLEAMTEEERVVWQAQKRTKREGRMQTDAERRAKMEEALRAGQRLVIDLDFGDCMTDSMLRSLASQLCYCHSVNSKSAAPFHMVLTSLHGRVATILSSQVLGVENWQVTRSERSYLEELQDCQERLVYLTADSPNTLEDLEEDKVYVIGGLVDHNRFKGICFERAERAGVATAKLPIGGHLKLLSSPVLTVNQVVAILVHWREFRDWGAALEAVVPLRKTKKPEGRRRGKRGPMDGGNMVEAEKEGDEVERQSEAEEEENGLEERRSRHGPDEIVDAA